MIRPTLKASWGRIRVANGSPVSPRAASAAACEAENPSTSPPTMAMQVEMPAVRPRTSTKSRPPRPGSDSPEVRSARPVPDASTTSTPIATAATTTVRHTDGSRVSQGVVPGS